jgi:ectoine hydroxylase-related dioxygenase (phytanoyl-CoA dioxygenase family)
MSVTAVETPTSILPRSPLSTERTREIIKEFQTTGAAVVGQIFDAEECAMFKEKFDRIFSNAALKDSHHLYNDFICTRLFELDRAFRDVMVREPLISLMEALLGGDCHLIANNAVRNRPGESIDSYHADDFVWVPLPDEIPRFDARMTFPTFLVNCQILLTDCESDEFGPTQFVPGSHYSGRQPYDAKNPQFEGRGGVSIHVPAGTLYLQHPQVWHRGAPNTSSRTRYLMQYGYSKRFVAQRFYPFLNYQMPHHVLEGANDRLLRVLGKHAKGAYG